MSISYYDYEDGILGIKLKYPDFLEPVAPTKSNPLLQFLPTWKKSNKFFPIAIKIDTGVVKKDQSLDEIWDEAVNVSLLNGYTVYESKYTTIGGCRGRMIRYGAPKIMIVDAMTIKNNRSYFFGFEIEYVSDVEVARRAIEEGIKMVNNVLDSIEIR